MLSTDYPILIDIDKGFVAGEGDTYVSGRLS